ncbi:SPOR domain-containing protein [Yoonia sp.]|uniref:SPOR domain-containing protein n=1 Tax=Yoonia sp. TaxID=2212373 RepID=UPI002FDAF395
MRRKLALVCLVGATLAACEQTGLLNRSAAPAETDRPMAINAPGQRVSQERDVERPDIFETTDRALWDGRPSLGGVWVAHPDVRDPERVLIRNTASGETIVGALFRRERLNPGPEIQISSDAADALGALAGSPVELYVVALRREETQVIVPADENPVVASLEAPVNVDAAPLDPAPAAEDAGPAPAETAAVVAAAPALAVAAETTDEGSQTATAAANLAAAATAAIDDTGTVDVSAVFETPIPPADGPRAQIGVYSNEGNANADAARIQAAGLAAEVLTETMGGQTVWRLVAGPLVSDAALAALQDIGFVDAFIITETTE